MRILIFLAVLTGCAAFRGDFVLTRRVDGVEVRHEHMGAANVYRTNGGGLPFWDGGFMLHIGRRTMYVANGTGTRIHVDVQCTFGGFPDFIIEAGHEQGFAEWDGNCSMVRAWQVINGVIYPP